MNEPPTVVPTSRRRGRGVVPLVLVLLTAAVYSGSFGVPFIFDDHSIIKHNQFMRSLWPPARAMEAPWRSTAAGRPLVSYSFAVNYAVSGLNVWSYHVFNLLVHLGNVLLLYGVARRVSALPALRSVAGGGGGGGRLWPALLAAAWAVHPLNSETVVYIAQRTELMMAFFMLAAFACLLRAAGAGAETETETQAETQAETKAETQPGGKDHGGGALWSLLAVVCGVLATLCKETAAVLPLLLLLFDRAFVAGSFGAAWRRRKGLHLGGLAVIAVAVNIALGDHRGGLETGNASVTWRYLLTQGAIILHYLRLCVVPWPLAITYEWPLVEGLRDGWLPAAVVAAGLGATVWALVKRPMVGFGAAAFYLLLAPTSSFIPIMSEVAAERRMYLPLLAVLALAIAAVAAAARVWLPAARRPAVAAGGAGFALAAVAAWSAVTVARVQDYQTAETIWRQTLRAQPESLYGRVNLAGTLVQTKRLDEAERLLKEVQLEAPGFPHLNAHLGRVAFLRKNYARAADLYLKAAHSVYGKPQDYAYAGFSLAMQGKREAGAHALGEALERAPEDPTTLNFVATVLSRDGKHADAVVYLEKILANYPEMSPVWSNLAHNLNQLGRVDAARNAFREAFRRDPDDPGVLGNFGNFEAKQKNYTPAVALFRRWLHLDPHAAEPLLKLVTLLVESGDDGAAGPAFERLVLLHPQNVEARQRYAWWLLNTGKVAAAERQAQAARALAPDNATTRELDAAIERRREAGAAPASPVPGLDGAPTP